MSRHSFVLQMCVSAESLELLSMFALYEKKRISTLVEWSGLEWIAQQGEGDFQGK